MYRIGLSSTSTSTSVSNNSLLLPIYIRHLASVTLLLLEHLTFNGWWIASPRDSDTVCASDLHLGVRNGLTTMLYSAAAAIVDDATFLSGKILQSRHEDMTC